MSLSCTESCVGVGFCNLVKWKKNGTNGNDNGNSICTQNQIYIL